MSSNSAANQEIGGDHLPIAVGTIMKQSTRAQKENCSNEPTVAANVRADEQHEQPAHDDERART